MKTVQVTWILFGLVAVGYASQGLAPPPKPTTTTTTTTTTRRPPPPPPPPPPRTTTTTTTTTRRPPPPPPTTGYTYPKPTTTTTTKPTTGYSYPKPTTTTKPPYKAVEENQAEAIVPDGPGWEDARPFDFTYAIKDDETLNDFGHNVESNGNVVTGEYRTLMADGRTQVVKYSADWKNGYNAEITYEGEASDAPNFKTNFKSNANAKATPAKPRQTYDPPAAAASNTNPRKIPPVDNSALSAEYY